MVIFTVIDGGLKSNRKENTRDAQTTLMGNPLDAMFQSDDDIISTVYEKRKRTSDLLKGLPIIPLLGGGVNERSLDLAWLRVVLQEKLDHVYTDISRLSLTEVLNDVNSELSDSGLSMLEFTRKEVYDVLVSLTGRTLFMY